MDMTLDVFVEGTKNESVGYISQLQGTIIV